MGVDISQGMLDFGQIKLNQKQLTGRITLQQADSEKLPFEDQSFDAVTVSFGVRNFENLIAGLSEMHRVLKSGGPMVVLEFSKPTNPVFSRLYWFYFKNILPLMGKLLSRSTNAYTYLPQSVAAFPEGEEFASKQNLWAFPALLLNPLPSESVQCIHA